MIDLKDKFHHYFVIRTTRAHANTCLQGKSGQSVLPQHPHVGTCCIASKTTCCLCLRTTEILLAQMRKPRTCVQNSDFFVCGVIR